MDTTQDEQQQAIAELGLPALDGLSEAQMRGTACVWNGADITTETAIDLGPRREQRPEGSFEWYPRACVPCVTYQALAALYDHEDSCDECRDSKAGTACPSGRALIRLSIRGGR